MKLPKIKKTYQLKDYNFFLLLVVLAITVLGIFVIGSAKHSVQNKQIFGMAIGIAAMAVLSLLDYVWILKFYWIAYAVNIALLVATKLFGTTVNGATRWIDLKVTTFQPSELSKIIMILFFAKYLTDHEDDLNSPKTIGTAILLLSPTLLLIYLQPDLSTTLSIAAVFCVMMYIGGLSYKIIGGVLVVMIPLMIIIFSIAIQPDQKIFYEHQQKRILAWLNPEEYAAEEAYQQNNSIMAIGSGQLKGKGLNNNTTTSVKNGNYILEPQTDFIFAIIGEELGFIGCCVTIGLLLLIVIICIIIGIRAGDPGGKLLCCGVASQIGIQSFINIAVATGMIPNTGIPLPFVSYGVTSLVTMYMGIGLVLNVGLQPKKYQ